MSALPKNMASAKATVTTTPVKLRVSSQVGQVTRFNSPWTSRKKF